MLLVISATTKLCAQTISPQKLPFSAICAGGPHPNNPSQVFNEYQAQFGISGFASDVTFIVELSDVEGAFTTPTATIALAPLPGTPADTEVLKTLTFAVPENLVGSTNYRLRVKSSTGVVSQPFTIFGSTSTKNFSAYFKVYNESFYINDKNATINFCSGGSVTLSVYNPTPEDVNSSPANFPQLQYNWYKDDVLIAGEKGSSLVVNSGGNYYAELDYGACTDVNFRSQGVTVTSTSGGSGGATIVSSLGNPFCASDATILSAPAGNTYSWRRDGGGTVLGTSQTYQTNIPGVYTCDIDFGGCNATATIDLKNNGSISANGTAIAANETIRIDQGDTVTVTASTTTASPSYQWYLNNAEINGATSSSLDITVAGNYSVSISGCSLDFKVSYDTVIDYNVPKIPNIISPNNDGNNDTWIIPNEYNNTNTHVLILSSFGDKVFETNNYDNTYGWPQSNIEFKNFNPIFYYIITPSVGSAKKGSITLLK